MYFSQRQCDLDNHKKSLTKLFVKEEDFLKIVLIWAVSGFGR